MHARKEYGLYMAITPRTEETTMYDMTPAQAATITRLEASGFRFSNWIPNDSPAHGSSDASGPVDVLMTKRRKGSTEYRQVDPEGNAN